MALLVEHRRRPMQESFGTAAEHSSDVPGQQTEGIAQVAALFAIAWKRP